MTPEERMQDNRERMASHPELQDAIDQKDWDAVRQIQQEINRERADESFVAAGLPVPDRTPLTPEQLAAKITADFAANAPLRKSIAEFAAEAKAAGLSREQAMAMIAPDVSDDEASGAIPAQGGDTKATAP